MNPPEHTKLTLEYQSPLRPDERNTEAEAMILANADPDKVRDLFKTTKEAASFYGRFQAHRFGRQKVDGICKSCGASTTGVIEAVWGTSMTLRAFEFVSLNQVDAHALKIEFAAYHSMCQKCAAKARDCLELSKRTLLGAVLIALTGPGVLVWSAFDPPWALALRPQLGRLFFILPLLLLALPILAIAIRHERRYNRLPASLRGIVPGAMINSLRVL